MSTGKTDEFIQLYNRLETSIRSMYDVPQEYGAVAWLVRNVRSYRSVSAELDYCREVRNLLQHRERIKDSYAVIPSDSMVETLRSVLASIEAVPRAADLGTKVTDIFSASLNDRIVPLMKAMHKRSFTLIPILKEGRVVGAFSENTLLTYLIKNNSVSFGEDDRFTLLSDLLPLDRHSSETFEFVAQDTPAPMIAEMFQKSLRNSERLEAAFVTAHGKRSERLLGMITSWDMAAFF
ncbi:MAG: hypothetical protein IJ092_08365 [Atopobiaceae bacterium]|nr:hypothetical protein [Atopobiaceae bacterium]